MIFLVDPDTRAETEKAHFLSHRMVMRALKMGGTCTGEHGIGYGKLQYMESEHGQTLAVMAGIKKALDPNHLMNPGKLIP